MNKEKIIINLPLTSPLLKEEYIRNKYMSMWLKTLNKEFREKINNEISNWNNKEDFLDYSKKIFWFNKENGWNFLCSVMDNIWNTISHISNLDYWKNAYYFSSEVKDWTFSILHSQN